MQEFKRELDFSKWFTDYLNNSIIYNKEGNSTSIISEHNKSKKNGRPDIKITTNSKLNMKWRELSNPFYIECKMRRISILYDLQQYIRYKYKQESNIHILLKKYGDFHVIASCPEWLDKNNNIPKRIVNEGNGHWLHNFWLVRVLWHLGLGVIYAFPTPNNHNRLQIAFNEMEVINAYPNK